MSTGSITPPICRLPVELLQLITLAIPLSRLSPTILSLCLTNRELNQKTQHLLYNTVVLPHNDAALLAFQKMQQNPEIGQTVKELYILSEFSATDRNGSTPVVYLGGLKEVVKQGLLPNLATIGIFNQSRWLEDRSRATVSGECTLPSSFWLDLATMAPRLRTVIIRNLADNFSSPWIDEEVIDYTAVHKNLISFNITIGIPSLGIDHAALNGRLLKNVQSMHSSLRCLTLRPIPFMGEINVSTVFNLHFPNLQQLSLYGFHSDSVSDTSPFWSTHEMLEHVALWNCTGRWFEQQSGVGLLPNLRHLKGSFSDIRALYPLLSQLRSLCVFDTHNMQIPYLMHHFIKTPLQNLLSLEIEQSASGSLIDTRKEGANWVVPRTGGKATTKSRKTDYQKHAMDSAYMSLIVEYIPNIQELGFLGDPFYEDEMIDNIGASLSRLRHLKHMYYPLGYAKDSAERLIGLTREMAAICPSLESHGHLRSDSPPMLAWVSRDDTGGVRNVAIKDKWGMEICVQGNDPFPDTREWMSPSNL